MMEPSLVKSLRLLRETNELLTEKDLVRRTGEDRAYVKKALERLVARGIIAKDGEFYEYRQTSGNEEFFKRLQAVYEKAVRKPRIELIVRGLLSGARRAYPCYGNTVVLLREGLAMPHLFRLKTLLKLLADEGFDSGEIHAFLEEEMQGGWLGRFEFYFGSKEKVSLLIPSCIPLYRLWFDQGRRMGAYGETRQIELVVVYHGKRISALGPYFSKLRQMGSEELEEYKGDLKERWNQRGWFVQEEAYLVGEYPLELANPARRYLDKEKPELMKRISEESFQRWFASEA